jgi:hypothetical protein
MDLNYYPRDFRLLKERYQTEITPCKISREVRKVSSMENGLTRLSSSLQAVTWNLPREL